MSDKTKKDWWDKSQVIANVISALVLVAVGWIVNSTIQSRETNAKLVETAIGVLKAKPDESNKGLRIWAINMVNKHSDVPLSWEAREELRTNTLPAGSYLTDQSGNILTDADGNRLITN